MIRYYNKKDFADVIYQVWDKTDKNHYSKFLSRIDGNHNTAYADLYNMSSNTVDCTRIEPFKEKNNILKVVEDCI